MAAAIFSIYLLMGVRSEINGDGRQQKFIFYNTKHLFFFLFCYLNNFIKFLIKHDLQTFKIIIAEYLHSEASIYIKQIAYLHTQIKKSTKKKFNIIKKPES